MAHDITFVNERVAVGGGIFVTSNMEWMKKKGITHIIDAQAEWDDTPVAEPLGIKVLWIPAHDDYSEPDKAEFERVAAFLKDIKPTDKVMAHCAAGVHRGPMYALLANCLLHPKKSVEAATREITEHRLIADFPTVYYSAVKDFVQQYRKRK